MYVQDQDPGPTASGKIIRSRLGLDLKFCSNLKKLRTVRHCFVQNAGFQNKFRSAKLVFVLKLFQFELNHKLRSDFNLHILSVMNTYCRGHFQLRL